MKPGMQRDLLVAFWFLFDEFEIGDSDCATRAGADPTGQVPPKNGNDAEKAKPRGNGAARQRRRP